MGQIGPKWDKSWTFKVTQNVLKLILKSPRFVSFGAILKNHFGAKPKTPAGRPRWRQEQTHGCFHSLRGAEEFGYTNESWQNWLFGSGLSDSTSRPSFHSDDQSLGLSLHITNQKHIKGKEKPEERITTQVCQLCEEVELGRITVVYRRAFPHYPTTSLIWSSGRILGVNWW